MSIHMQISFASEADGLEIYGLEIIPEGDVRGIVQLVHGMSEHKERYIPFMEYLAENGYVSVIHDQRGHGESVKDKKDLGYMYGGGAEALLQDILTVNQRIREEYPGVPLILFGHSMGSLAVRAFASDHDDCIDMLIVCGSPSKNGARAMGETIAKLEGRVKGMDHKSRLLEAMSLGAYASKFAKEGSKLAWLSTNKENVAYYAASELCGFTFTDDAYIALFGLMKKAYDTKHWNCTKEDMPVLFISGAEDPCMVNVRKFAQAVRAMREAGYTDVRGRLYKDMRHEILNETGKEKVWADVVLYIRRKIG